MSDQNHLRALVNGTNNLNKLLGQIPSIAFDVSGEDFTTNGVTLPSFAGCQFKAGANFSGCRFPTGVLFEDCTITGEANFGGCTFAGDLEFKGVSITQLNLSGASVSGRLRLTPRSLEVLNAEELVVSGPSRWSMSASQRHIRMQGSRFGSTLSISGLNVTESLIADGATFLGDAQFRGSSDATFSARACTFENLLSLETFQFRGGLDLSNSKLKSHSTLRNTQLTSTSAFRQLDCSDSFDMSATSLDYVDTASVDFSGSTFRKGFTSTGRHFKSAATFFRVQFDQPPRFFACEFSQDTTFEESKFSLGDNAYEGERAFRALKQAMSNLHAHVEEMRFFSLELQEKGRSANLARGLLYKSYWFLSKAGQSVMRPILLLVGCVVVGTLVLWLLVDIECFRRSWKSQSVACGFDSRRAYAIAQASLAQSLPFVPAIKEAGTSAVEKLAGDQSLMRLLYAGFAFVQASASIIALFLVGLAFRNVFRMR